MRKFIYYSLLTIVFIGCKSTRTFYNNQGELRNITDAKLIASVEDNYIDGSTIFFKKFKAEVDFNDDSKSFKGNLYLNIDSSIIVSINPLMGIELFRVKFSPGKVEIIDRTKKVYSTGDYELLWEKFNVEMDFYTLQAILLNELYTYPLSYPEDRFIKRYKHENSDDAYLLQSVKSGKYNRMYKNDKTSNIIFHQFSIMPEVFKISKSYIKDFEVNSEVSITYGNFTENGNTLLPLLFNIDGKKESQSFSMKINFENFEIDGTSSIGFKVSSKYKHSSL